MKKYHAYKDSGIEWIGEIPEHWDVMKLKYVVIGKLKYGANESGEENPQHPRYIRITDFGNDGNLHDDTFKSLTPEKANEYLLSEGDLLFARSGATVGKTFKFKNYTGQACFAGYLIKATANSNFLISDFLYIFTKSGAYENWKSSIFSQATIENIGADKYANLNISIPPLPEQTVIAAYLERKTAEIDELIADKKRLIELYEEEKTAIINQAVTKGIDPDVSLKPSGIEWLGDVPEHWEVKKLKYVGSIKYGLGQPPKLKADGLPLIRATDISKGKIDISKLIYVDPLDVPYDRDPVLKENDIIVVRSGAYTADSAIVPKSLEGAITGYDMVFRSNSSCFPLFIAYCLLSHYVLNKQLLLHSIRAAQPHLNREELGETIFFTPPKDEQITIVDFINNEIIRVENKIIKTQKLIDLLTEYRTALISEVVTGKVKVFDDDAIHEQKIDEIKEMV